MKKAYHLGKCSACQRILNELDWKWETQEIRTEKITTAQLEQMAQLSGSYESLFSRRSLKYKSMGLKDKLLTENDFKNFILEEDTFLKRPVFIIDGQIFIGNSKKIVEEIKAVLHV